MAVTIERIATECAGELHLRQGSPDLEVSHIAINGADARPDGLFAAVAGTRSHGAKFAGSSQAAAIVTDKPGYEILKTAGETRPVIVFDDLRAHLGAVSALVCGNPSACMTVIGITGTSGKTTTSYMMEAGLAAAGATVGLIGTTGTRIAGKKVPTSLTTPEAPTLQELFLTMRDAGVTHVVMEVSSHAIALGRVGGVDFDIALFTNLSQDHLDFHPTMEDYFHTKAKLFVPGSPLRAKKSIICVDDKWGVDLTRLAGPAATTVSTKGAPANFMATDIETEPDGTSQFTVAYKGKKQRVTLHIPGVFNVANASLAIAAAAFTDLDVRTFIAGLASIQVPGRMEKIDNDKGVLAVVDYAHKPAALEAAIKAVRDEVEGRVIAVFGAGGDRDHGKRPIMGSAAVAGADVVIITDDNPRSEDPATIRKAIEDGAKEFVVSHPSRRSVEICNVGDRGQAIALAVNKSQAGDAIIVAGKGHEQGQLVGGEMRDFDDRIELRRALAADTGAQES
ncbi:UDP-N-acetylmuramoyl-L-alanyl-D-glutamate--2,6-diaminopimelate ligase [Corynebacterium glucuronolyticum]|uniref:UDP-N-acetylmuramoyl-L-alanyl-D-glutamate--2, 6-diaminopimelate ligase n=1 Tax=Corynebacterium glucuronolyticum TaxID=39791 RepID=UPI003F6E1412